MKVEKATEPAPKPAPKKKMTYKERLEFENLGREIPQLEQLKVQLNEQINSGNLPYDQLNEMVKQLTDVTEHLEKKELRWLELSELAESDLKS